MKTQLDKVKSTITISLGTKNRLRNLKGPNSYEQFINYLIRTHQDKNESSTNANMLELQKFERKKGLITKNQFSILFSYNKYTNSNSYFFDIELENITYKGQKSTLTEFFKSLNNKQIFIYNIADEYKLHFQMLEQAINQEIEPQFKHNGTVLDYFKWKQEFKILNLPAKSFNEDIMEKLNNIDKNIQLYDRFK